MRWIQNWYADDGSCLGKFENLIEWLKLLMKEGPRFGYYNELSKMILIVAPQFAEEAKLLFQEYGIVILTGHRLLGGFIGTEEEKLAWIKQKNDFWIKSVNKLAEIAKSDPHSVFIAISKSLQNEWGFVQRTTQLPDDSFLPLKEAIYKNLLPSMCGFDIDKTDADLMMRPSRFGGIGIRDPVKTAHAAYQTSVEASLILKQSIMSGAPLDLNAHSIHCKKVSKNLKEEENQKNEDEVRMIIQNLPDEQKQHMSRILDHKCSAWLAVNPWEDEFFNLHADEFRDSVACRYGKTPPNLPAWCDGCGKPFDVNHALECKNGGLVYQRHNEMRDENCDLNKKAGFSQVICEPIVRDADVNGLGELRGDWSVRGFWTPQRMAVFDTRIFNARASSYKSLSLEAAFDIHRRQKKKLYSRHVELKRGSFTPILATCEGILDREAEAYVKRLALHLSKRWEKGYSQTVFWVKARIQVCILRSVSNCFRGSRTKWRGGNIEDGAAMPALVESDL